MSQNKSVDKYAKAFDAFDLKIAAIQVAYGLGPQVPEEQLSVADRLARILAPEGARFAAQDELDFGDEGGDADEFYRLQHGLGARQDDEARPDQKDEGQDAIERAIEEIEDEDQGEMLDPSSVGDDEDGEDEAPARRPNRSTGVELGPDGEPLEAQFGKDELDEATGLTAEERAAIQRGDSEDALEEEQAAINEEREQWEAKADGWRRQKVKALQAEADQIQTHIGQASSPDERAALIDRANLTQGKADILRGARGNDLVWQYEKALRPTKGGGDSEGDKAFHDEKALADLSHFKKRVVDLDKRKNPTKERARSTNKDRESVDKARKQAAFSEAVRAYTDLIEPVEAEIRGRNRDPEAPLTDEQQAELSAFVDSPNMREKRERIQALFPNAPSLEKIVKRVMRQKGTDPNRPDQFHNVKDVGQAALNEVFSPVGETRQEHPAPFHAEKNGVPEFTSRTDADGNPVPKTQSIHGRDGGPKVKGHFMREPFGKPDKDGRMQTRPLMESGEGVPVLDEDGQPQMGPSGHPTVEHRPFVSEMPNRDYGALVMDYVKNAGQTGYADTPAELPEGLQGMSEDELENLNDYADKVASVRRSFKTMQDLERQSKEIVDAAQQIQDRHADSRARGNNADLEAKIRAHAAEKGWTPEQAEQAVKRGLESRGQGDTAALKQHLTELAAKRKGLGEQYKEAKASKDAVMAGFPPELHRSVEEMAMPTRTDADSAAVKGLFKQRPDQPGGVDEALLNHVLTTTGVQTPDYPQSRSVEDPNAAAYKFERHSPVVEGARGQRIQENENKLAELQKAQAYVRKELGGIQGSKHSPEEQARRDEVTQSAQAWIRSELESVKGELEGDELERFRNQVLQTATEYTRSELGKDSGLESGVPSHEPAEGAEDREDARALTQERMRLDQEVDDTQRALQRDRERAVPASQGAALDQRGELEEKKLQRGHELTTIQKALEAHGEYQKGLANLRKTSEDYKNTQLAAEKALASGDTAAQTRHEARLETLKKTMKTQRININLNKWRLGVTKDNGAALPTKEQIAQAHDVAAAYQGELRDIDNDLKRIGEGRQPVVKQESQFERLVDDSRSNPSSFVGRLFGRFKGNARPDSALLGKGSKSPEYTNFTSLTGGSADSDAADFDDKYDTAMNGVENDGGDAIDNALGRHFQGGNSNPSFYGNDPRDLLGDLPSRIDPFGVASKTPDRGTEGSKLTAFGDDAARRLTDMRGLLESHLEENPDVPLRNANDIKDVFEAAVRRKYNPMDVDAVDADGDLTGEKQSVSMNVPDMLRQLQSVGKEYDNLARARQSYVDRKGRLEQQASRFRTETLRATDPEQKATLSAQADQAQKDAAEYARLSDTTGDEMVSMADHYNGVYGQIESVAKGSQGKALGLAKKELKLQEQGAVAQQNRARFFGALQGKSKTDSSKETSKLTGVESVNNPDMVNAFGDFAAAIQRKTDEREQVEFAAQAGDPAATARLTALDASIAGLVEKAKRTFQTGSVELGKEKVGVGRPMYWSVKHMGARPSMEELAPFMDRLFARRGAGVGEGGARPDPVAASLLFPALGLSPEMGIEYAMRGKENDPTARALESKARMVSQELAPEVEDDAFPSPEQQLVGEVDTRKKGLDEKGHEDEADFAAQQALDLAKGHYGKKTHPSKVDSENTLFRPDNDEFMARMRQAEQNGFVDPQTGTALPLQDVATYLAKNAVLVATIKKQMLEGKDVDTNHASIQHKAARNVEAEMQKAGVGGAMAEQVRRFLGYRPDKNAPSGFAFNRGAKAAMGTGAKNLLADNAKLAKSSLGEMSGWIMNVSRGRLGKDFAQASPEEIEATAQDMLSRGEGLQLPQARFRSSAELEASGKHAEGDPMVAKVREYEALERAAEGAQTPEERSALARQLDAKRAELHKYEGLVDVGWSKSGDHRDLASMMMRHRHMELGQEANYGEHGLSPRSVPYYSAKAADRGANAVRDQFHPTFAPHLPFAAKPYAPAAPAPVAEAPAAPTAAPEPVAAPEPAPTAEAPVAAPVPAAAPESEFTREISASKLASLKRLAHERDLRGDHRAAGRLDRAIALILKRVRGAFGRG